MVRAEEHLGLVQKATLDVYRRQTQYPYEDLFQQGCIALMAVVETFDETRGVRFSTYAYTRILWAVSRYAIRDNSWLIGSTRQRLKGAAKAPASFSVFLDENGNEYYPAFFGTVAFEEDKINEITVKSLMDKLKPVERQVIELSYFAEAKQADIGKKLGLSQANVSRIKGVALKKMRQAALAADLSL